MIILYILIFQGIHSTPLQFNYNSKKEASLAFISNSFQSKIIAKENNLVWNVEDYAFIDLTRSSNLKTLNLVSKADLKTKNISIK